MTTSDECAREALAMVFDAWAVTSMRPDSPLTALGMTVDDEIAVCDAVHAVGGVRLLDADFATITTLADLCRAIEQSSASAESS